MPASRKEARRKAKQYHRLFIWTSSKYPIFRLDKRRRPLYNSLTNDKKAAIKMKYPFEQVINRKGTNSSKWDSADQRFGGTGLLPLSIADMDFAVPAAIVDRMKQRLEFPIFGYEKLSEEYYAAVVQWMARKHHYPIDKDWVVYTSDVCAALSYAVDALTPEGAEVLVPTPVYHHFFSSIERMGRIVRAVPLKRDAQGRCTYDFDALQAAVNEKTAAIMLCSPHNPVGRVWNRDELEQMTEFCLKNRLLVLDDEIHQDIVFEKEHLVLPSLSAELEQRCVLCTAPSKAFNVAGMKVANIIIPNEKMRKAYQACMRKHGAAEPHAMAAPVVVGAYCQSDSWLEEMLIYVKGNIDYFCEEIEKRVPMLKPVRPEGTYMIWVDFSALNMSPEEIKKFLAGPCKLAVNQGAIFGPGGEQFARFNLACPRSIVEEAIRRLECGISTL